MINRRISVLCLTFLLLFSFVFGFSSCSAEESDDELISIARALCEASVKVNEICYGDGIAAAEDGYSLGAYTAASEASMEEYGVTSVAQIKSEISKVYSTGISVLITQTVLSSGKNESGALTYARYYDSAEEAYSGMMVKKDHVPMMKGTCSYSDYKILDAKKNEVRFSLTVTVTYEGKSRVLPETEFTMIKENGSWRLDTVSYATYYES